jgi:hypothetical protein
MIEWIHFWEATHEGRLMRTAVRKAAGLPLDTPLWWTAFACAVARTPFLDKLAQMPIYGPVGGKLLATELFVLTVLLKHQTQIKGWQQRSSEEEKTERNAP